MTFAWVFLSCSADVMMKYLQVPKTNKFNFLWRQNDELCHLPVPKKHRFLFIASSNQGMWMHYHVTRNFVGSSVEHEKKVVFNWLHVHRLITYTGTVVYVTTRARGRIRCWDYIISVVGGHLSKLFLVDFICQILLDPSSVLAKFLI